MIQFINNENIEICNSFSQKYQKVINEIHSDDTIPIKIITPVDNLFNYIFFPHDPFATNTLMKPSIIGFNEQVCAQLNLTQEEQYAMIAHEIGHVLDKTERQMNNQLIREMNADQLAIDIGLSKELKSGLEKIIKSNEYPNDSEYIKRRIDKISIIVR